MAVIHSKTCPACPENPGLSEITVRVIMNPLLPESTITYAERTVDRISERIFKGFVQDIVADPTQWTLETLATTDFGRLLDRYSHGQLYISDAITSHTVKNPSELLLSFEVSVKSRTQN